MTERSPNRCLVCKKDDPLMGMSAELHVFGIGRAIMVRVHAACLNKVGVNLRG